MPSNKKADKKTRAPASTAAARAKGSANRSKSVAKSLAKRAATGASKTGASKTGASRSGTSKTKAAAAKTRGGAISANKTAARAATSSSRKTSVKSSAKNAPKKAAKEMKSKTKSKTANSAKSTKEAVRKVAKAVTRAATHRGAASARSSTARSVSAAKTRVSKTQTVAKKPAKAAVAAKAAKISAAKTSAKATTAAPKATAAKGAQIVSKNKKAPQAPVAQAAKGKASPATAIKAPAVKQPIAAKAAPPKPAAPAVAASSVQPKPAVAQQAQPLSKRPPGHSYIPPSPAVRRQQGVRAPVPGLHPASPIVKAKPTASQKLGFKLNEFIVYPAHGVGQITGVEIQEVAGFSLELFVVSFIKDKMILKVPTSKVDNVGMRKLAEGGVVDKALMTLSGRARVKRTMWSRRAQEYEAKINSGDLITIAEVVRDLYRSDTQPEQSYSERQLYEAALDRMAREIAAVRKLIDSEALKLIESYLLKGPRRGQKSDADGVEDAPDETDVDRAA